MAPATTIETIVSTVTEVSTKSERGQGNWVIFNTGKNPMYLNPARHDLDSLVRFLAYLTEFSAPTNDNAAASSLKQTAQALSELVAAVSSADGQPACGASGSRR